MTLVMSHPIAPAPLKLQPEDRHASSICYAGAAFAAGQAVQLNNGALHTLGLAWLAAAIALLIVALRGRDISFGGAPSVRTIVGVMISIQWIELLVWGVRWLPRGNGSIAIFVGGMIVAGAAVIAILRWPRSGVCLTMLIVGHVIAGGYVIRAMPHPGIDVWHFQQGSTDALLHGENPYTVRYRNLYDSDTNFYSREMIVDGWLTCSCPYPPMSLLFATSGRLLGDVRWSHLLALEIAAALIVLAAPGAGGFWAAALLLLHPRALLVIGVAWTDPFVILMLAVTICCALRAPRMLWMPLGVLLATKQYTALLLPLVFLLMQGAAKRREILGLIIRALGLAAAINLPFFLWNPNAFVNNVITLQFRLPFQMDALSFTAWFAHRTGIQIGAGAGFILAALALLWTSKHAPRNPAGFAGATALVMLVFFSLNKQASCNYYFLVAACCSFAAALSWRATKSIAAQRGDENFVTKIAA